MEKITIILLFSTSFQHRNQQILWKTLPEEATGNMHACSAGPRKKAGSNADQEQSPNLHHFRHENDHYSVYLNWSNLRSSPLALHILQTV